MVVIVAPLSTPIGTEQERIGLTVDMHGASAALRDAASEFGSGQANRIAQRPKKGRIGLEIDLMLRPVDCKRDHRLAPA